MSSLTRYFKFVKPDVDEIYDVTVFNNNLDKIDRELNAEIASDSFISEDEEDPEELATMPEVMADGDNRSTLFNKISIAVKNVRYIIKLIGSTDISEIGDGTISDILSLLNSSLSDFMFRNNNGIGEYSMDEGTTWIRFGRGGGGDMPILNYSTPLHTFSTGNLSYTATKDCYLVGITSGDVTIDDVKYATRAISYYDTQSQGVLSRTVPLTIPIYPIGEGSTVVVSTASEDLHICEEA